jgi:thymidylate synthase (FAD)
VIKKYPVLDNGHVEYIDHMGSDLTVVNAARVSFDKRKEKFDESDEKLIKYLSKHSHWTPFAHPQITLRIKAPVPIRTQFFKHKQGFVENEISRRYVDFEPEFYHPKWRKRPPTGGAKQGSDGELECINGGGETSGGFATFPLYRDYDNFIIVATRLYEDLIAHNVAPEQARFVLPQSMYTEWYWSGSLAAFGRFFKLRTDSHAQWEIQQYALNIGKIMEELFPVSWKYIADQDALEINIESSDEEEEEKDRL